ncbi:MAG: HD domain-containing protein [Fimbriiglobus sp.]|jgi:3'-5' exoribonuclease|nr:HD domain-containing protein [Fimbriiglobus sp.]
MGRRYVDQLRDGESLDDIYLVTDKQLRMNRNGIPFIQMELRDRTGGIPARLFNAGEHVFRTFDNGDYVQCEGKAQLYQGGMQVVLDRLERVDPHKVLPSDFLAQSEQDVPKLYERLRGHLHRLANPHLKALAECFLMDDQFVRGFTTAPAGVKLHHAYIGGLLEHSVVMMDLAERIAPFYPGADKDLVIVGLFLHDIGKTRELTYENAFGYSDEGQLLGHITMGVEMLTEKLKQVPDLTGEPFPRELVVRLKHLILSHHGTHEFGSPKVPMTPEAMLVHSIDMMDTKMHMILREIKEDRHSPSAWTPYNHTLGRRLYKGGANGDLLGGGGETYD